MAKKTEDIKFKVSDTEKAMIELKSKEARYHTRAAYLRDCALLGAPVHLSEIAVRIGQLSLLCNEVLCEAEEGNHRKRRLAGPAEKKAIKKIMATCDAVTQELREITSCAHI